MKIGSIVWGVKDLEKAVEFWSEVLNYRLARPADEDWAMLVPKKGEGIQLSLNKISSNKARRHHMDLFTHNQKEEVDRLLKLGATKAQWNYPKNADYVVLRDPDGNSFCVVQI